MDLENPRNPLPRAPAGRGGSILLSAQRLDRIEAGRPERRVETEYEADRAGQSAGKQNAERRDRHPPAGLPADPKRSDDSEKRANEAASQREPDRLDDELEDEISLPGANGHMHAELSGSFADRNQHDVHDADPADRQGDRGGGNEEPGERARRAGAGAKNLGGGTDGEVVRHVAPESMPMAQQGLDLALRLGRLGGVGNLDGNEIQIVPRRAVARSDEAASGHRQRDKRHVVLVAPGGADAFRIEHRDDHGWDLADSDGLAERRSIVKQSAGDGRADNGDLGAEIEVVRVNEPAFRRGPLPRLQIVGGHARDQRRPVSAAGDHLQPLRNQRRRDLNVGDLLPDRQSVALGQISPRALLLSDAMRVWRARRHRQQIGSEGAQAFRDLVLGSGPDRHRADHGGDPDNHAERRQKTPAGMNAKRSPADVEAVRWAHGSQAPAFESLTTAPSRRMTRRRARSATSLACVTTQRVRASCLRSSGNDSVASAVRLSKAPVGSSASTSAGLLTRARAIDTRCCSPPESSRGRCSRRAPSPTRRSASSARWRRSAAGTPA